MSGDYNSQLQKPKYSYINTDKVMHKAPRDENGDLDYEKMLAHIARLSPPKCILCGQDTPGLIEQHAFGQMVHVHPLCLADLAAKVGRNSQESKQEHPMQIGKDMASKSLGEPLNKSLSKAWVKPNRLENEQAEEAHVTARNLAESTHREYREKYPTAFPDYSYMKDSQRNHA